MKLIPLQDDNLHLLSKQLTCPSYDRVSIKSGIVHIGVGGFHRSHQAFYIHQLLEKHQEYDWGICGVGIREADRKMKDALGSQDNLYTLITQHPHGQVNCQIIGAHTDYILAVDSPRLAIG